MGVQAHDHHGKAYDRSQRQSRTAGSPGLLGPGYTGPISEEVFSDGLAALVSASPGHEVTTQAQVPPTG